MWTGIWPRTIRYTAVDGEILRDFRSRVLASQVNGAATTHRVPGQTGLRAAAKRALAEHPRMSETAVVVAVLLALQTLTFRHYYNGDGLPEWDFMSHYNADAHAWWHDGSFFQPVQWVPYLWGGYPGTLDLQNGSWYLPIGISSALTGYDLHAAAILSALHVAAGALGLYLLARSWRLRPSAALVGLVVWHFAAGFYANASHLDIARAYMWVPWVFLCASPHWPWRRWWAPLIATLVFWQATMGIYPGILIAGVYSVAIWVFVHQLGLKARWREYLIPLTGSLALAGLLSMPRFLTAYFVRGLADPSTSTSDIWSWTLAGTFLYPYGDARIPNDITMRSFFLPAVVLAALAFVPWRKRVSRAMLGVGVAAVALGLPVSPLQDWAERLPGLGVSRLRMSDFKVFLLFSMAMLAVLAIDAVVTARRRAPWGVNAGFAITKGPALGKWRGAYLLVVTIAAALIGFAGPFDRVGWIAQWGLLVISSALLIIAGTTLSSGQLRAVTASLVFLAGLSGVVWAFSTPATWLVSRSTTENAYYGASVSDLIASRTDLSGTRRPARVDSISTPADYKDLWWHHDSVASFYDGRLGLSGYVNLKGSRTFNAISQALSNPESNADARSFWLAPGLIIETHDGQIPNAEMSQRCAAGGECGVSTAESIRYTEPSHLVYRVGLDSPTEMSFNEAFYPGWRIVACHVADAAVCSAVDAREGTGGQIVVDLPAGEWFITLDYHLPGMRLAWWSFGTGAAALGIWSIVIEIWRRRASRRGADSRTPDIAS